MSSGADGDSHFVTETTPEARDAADLFLQTWDFDGYKREFWTAKVHSRRASVAAAMRVFSTD
jgi:hypothetical protein